MRVDRGGEFWNIVIGAAIGAVVGVAVSAFSQLTDKEAPTVFEGDFWAHIGVSAATGAVSGGLAASGIGIAGQIVGNALIGAAGAVADTKIDDKGNASVDTYLLKATEVAALGAVSGAIGGKGSSSKHVSNHFWRMVGSKGSNFSYYYSQIKKQSIRDGLSAIGSIIKATAPTVTKSTIKSAIQQ